MIHGQVVQTEVQNAQFLAGPLVVSFDLVKDFIQLLAQEHGNLGWRSITGSQPQIVSGSGYGGQQDVRVIMHRLDYRDQKEQKLEVVHGLFTRIQEVVSFGILEAPVVVFSASVDSGKGLFVQQQFHIGFSRAQPHQFHQQQVMIAGDVGVLVKTGDFILLGRHFIVPGFDGNTQFPGLDFQGVKELHHLAGDSTEVVIFHLLALGRQSAHQGPAAEEQVWPLAIGIFIDQKEFLLGPHHGVYPAKVLFSQEVQQSSRRCRKQIAGAQQGSLFIQSFAVIGKVDRWNAQRGGGIVFQDKSRTAGVPGCVTPTGETQTL